MDYLVCSLMKDVSVRSMGADLSIFESIISECIALVRVQLDQCLRL